MILSRNIHRGIAPILKNNPLQGNFRQNQNFIHQPTINFQNILHHWMNQMMQNLLYSFFNTSVPFSLKRINTPQQFHFPQQLHASNIKNQIAKMPMTQNLNKKNASSIIKQLQLITAQKNKDVLLPPLIKGNPNAVYERFSGNNIFHNYDQKTPQEKLHFVNQMESALACSQDFALSFDRCGNMMVDRAIHANSKHPTGDWRHEKNHKPWLNRYNNGLAARGANPNDPELKHHLSNSEFMVIPSLGTSRRYTNPHHLMIPRWKNNQQIPFKEITDFLKYASPHQKIAFVDGMHNILAHCPPMPHNPHRQFPQYEQLFWINGGKRREIPYMHLHFKPPAGINYKSFLF